MTVVLITGQEDTKRTQGLCPIGDCLLGLDLPKQQEITLTKEETE